MSMFSTRAPGRRARGLMLGALALFATLALPACSSLPGQPASTTLTLLAINDLHGHLQVSNPVPWTYPANDPARPGATVQAAHGGLPHLMTALETLRTQAGSSLTVGVGDMIGGSPLGSSLLKDEPTIEALNLLGVSVSVVGNHEFDAGRDELQRRIRGQCPAGGCALPGYKGARFEYIAANVLEGEQPWLKPYVIRELNGVKIAFIGAVTRDTPNIVSASGIRGLRFTEEAQAINRFVPTARAEGAQVFVALVHEGGRVPNQPPGVVNDPSYACDGLEGSIVGINERLDPAISVVFSAHTHQAYTCKRNGRLLVQGQAYGALVSEVKLVVDRKTGAVSTATAFNHKVAQSAYGASPAAKPLLDEVERLTGPIKNKTIATLPAQLTRRSPSGSDSPLGGVIADAQLAYVRKLTPADVAFMNPGGVRADLPVAAAQPPITVSMADAFATQPFGNDVVVLSLSGAQILELLQQQWAGRDADSPRLLQPSQTLTYRWDARLPIEQRIIDLRINGAPLDPARSYRVVVNSFMAEGGDRFTALRQGKERQIIGQDIEALIEYLQTRGDALRPPFVPRVTRVDAPTARP
jgi:5'-nucleotidase